MQSPALAILVFLSVTVCNPTWAQASNIDLRDAMTTVKHQGQRGTCNTFAAVALMEFLLREKTGQEFDLSENYTYWLARHRAPDSSYTRRVYRDGDGTAGYLAVRALEYGVMNEQDWPYFDYSPSQLQEARCKKPTGDDLLNCFTGWLPDHPRLLPYRAHSIFIDRDQISRFLLEQKIPVAINMLWVNSLLDREGNFVRVPTAAEVKACQKSGNCGHVILLVGYDSKTRRFIFRNSWGANWGQKGYGTIPEEYVLNFCEICSELQNLDRFSSAARDFIVKVSKGVSAQLAD